MGVGSEAMAVREGSAGYGLQAAKPSVPVGYKQTEVGIVPDDWEVVSLGEIGESLIGLTYKPSEVREVGTLVLRSSNIQNDKLSFEDNVFVDADISERIMVRPDDVLICVRNGSRDLIGKSALLDERTNGMTFGAFMAIYRSPIGRFASYLFQSSILKRQINQHLGATINQITNKSLNSFVIAAPPSGSEQRAIATALSDMDALLDGLDRLIAKKRDLKQATMQQLLTGQTRLPGFEGEWEEKQLGDCLCSQPDYGINAAAVPFSDRLPSYIRITDISEYGRFCPEPWVSVNAANADQYFLRDGDVVFARTGASVGKSYLYQPQDGQLVFAGFLIRVRPNPEFLIAGYLAAYANTKPYWDWVNLMSMRSGQPGINGKEYAQLPIQLPPADEQAAITTILSDMDAEIESLEQRRLKTNDVKQAMMQELLSGRTRLV